MTHPNRREAIAGLALAPLLGGAAAPALRMEQVSIKAPFPMEPIAVPDFTSAPRFPITRFGARPADRRRNTRAIAHAIAAASKARGGRVVVPAGTWDVGGIRLLSHVDLHLEEGAMLLFSPDPADYLPPVSSSWEGVECMNYAPLIYAYDCENIAISGRGKVQARMDVWQQWAGRPKAHLDALIALYQMARAGVPTEQRDMTKGEAHLRPQFIQFNRCRHALIEDISIENSPFWTVHLYLSRDVVLRRANIRAWGHNNDGCDPEMSQNVLIEDCRFDQGDDAVSVKSGREDDAWRLASPARNIVVRRCHVRNGHQLMAIGSELSGGVENVWVDQCRVFQEVRGETNSDFNNLLYIKTNERRGGFVRGIHMTNIAAGPIKGGVLSIETDVLYQWRTLLPTYQRRLTPIEGVHVSGIKVASAGFRVNIKAEREAPVRDVTLSDVAIDGAVGTALDNVASFSDH